MDPHAAARSHTPTWTAPDDWLAPHDSPRPATPSHRRTQTAELAARPPTTNVLAAADRSQLRRTARKLERVLGETPTLVHDASPQSGSSLRRRTTLDGRSATPTAQSPVSPSAHHIRPRPALSMDLPRAQSPHPTLRIVPATDPLPPIAPSPLSSAAPTPSSTLSPPPHAPPTRRGSVSSTSASSSTGLTPPASPAAPRRQMAKLQRYLGENVPADLLLAPVSSHSSVSSSASTGTAFSVGAGSIAEAATPPRSLRRAPSASGPGLASRAKRRLSLELSALASFNLSARLAAAGPPPPRATSPAPPPPRTKGVPAALSIVQSPTPTLTSPRSSLSTEPGTPTLALARTGTNVSELTRRSIERDLKLRPKTAGMRSLREEAEADPMALVYGHELPMPKIRPAVKSEKDKEREREKEEKRRAKEELKRAKKMAKAGSISIGAGTSRTSLESKMSFDSFAPGGGGGGGGGFRGLMRKKSFDAWSGRGREHPLPPVPASMTMTMGTHTHARATSESIRPATAPSAESPSNLRPNPNPNANFLAIPNANPRTPAPAPAPATEKVNPYALKPSPTPVPQQQPPQPQRETEREREREREKAPAPMNSSVSSSLPPPPQQPPPEREREREREKAPAPVFAVRDDNDRLGAAALRRSGSSEGRPRRAHSRRRKSRSMTGLPIGKLALGGYALELDPDPTWDAAQSDYETGQRRRHGRALITADVVDHSDGDVDWMWRRGARPRPRGRARALEDESDDEDEMDDASGDESIARRREMTMAALAGVSKASSEGAHSLPSAQQRRLRAEWTDASSSSLGHANVSSPSVDAPPPAFTDPFSPARAPLPPVPPERPAQLERSKSSPTVPPRSAKRPGAAPPPLPTPASSQTMLPGTNTNSAPLPPVAPEQKGRFARFFRSGSASAGAAQGKLLRKDRDRERSLERKTSMSIKQQQQQQQQQQQPVRFVPAHPLPPPPPPPANFSKGHTPSHSLSLSHTATSETQVEVVDSDGRKGYVPVDDVMFALRQLRAL